MEAYWSSNASMGQVKIN